MKEKEKGKEKEKKSGYNLLSFSLSFSWLSPLFIMKLFSSKTVQPEYTIRSLYRFCMVPDRVMDLLLEIQTK